MLKKTLLAALVFGAAATAVQANEMSGYATYSVGYAHSEKPKEVKELEGVYKNNGGHTSSDRSSTGHKVVLGLNVHPNVALEAQYTDLGRVTYKGSLAPLVSSKIDAKTRGLGANVVGKYPINDFTVFAKAGIHKMETKVTAKAGTAGFGSANESDKDREWVPSFGLGAAYDLTPELSVVAEYERYNDVADAYNVDLTSVGLRYNF
ncbi:MAG: outer membrane beta-barrel protein [Pseudomonas sp.]|nr:outer membrane beta-barrel protein [Pseudomonas sp.]